MCHAPHKVPYSLPHPINRFHLQAGIGETVVDKGQFSLKELAICIASFTLCNNSEYIPFGTQAPPMRTHGLGPEAVCA